MRVFVVFMAVSVFVVVLMLCVCSFDLGSLDVLGASFGCYCCRGCCVLVFVVF